MSRACLVVVVYGLLSCCALAQTSDPDKKSQPPEFDGLKALKHPDQAVRLSAVQLLCDLGPVGKFALPALNEQLKEEKVAIVRVKIVETLWKIEKPPARTLLPILENALSDKDAPTRASAVHVIGQMGAPAKSLVSALAKMLQDKDLTVRIEAALALGEMGAAARTAVAALLETLKSEDVFLLEPFVVGTLAKIGEDAVPELIAALSAKELRLKRGAATALGFIGPPAAAAAEPLAKLLTAPETDLRFTAVRAIGKLGPAAKSTAPALRKTLNDPEPGPRIQAAVALSLVGQDLSGLDVLAKSVKHEDFKVREQACRAYGELGSAKVGPLPELIEAVKDANPNVRAAAAEALGKIGNMAAALPMLRSAFKDEDPVVRTSAALAVWRIEPKADDVIPSLAIWLADKDAPLRKAAAVTLGEMGSAARPAWERLLTVYRDDEVIQVQRAAGLALLKIDAKAAAKAGVR